MSYIHQLASWPRLIWDQQRIASVFGTVRNRQGHFRDILDLVEKGVLIKDSAGGRSTSYRLCVTGPAGQVRT